MKQIGIHLLQAALPGQAFWQPYLDQSTVSWEKIAAEPFAVLRGFLPESLGDLLRNALESYASVLLFLLLAAVLSMFLTEQTDHTRMELLTVGGCGTLVWKNLLDFTAVFCEKIDGWQRYLMGFLPVYAGVLTMGGETSAGGAASGSLLVLLCVLAQVLCTFLPPLLECYLALSVASCISSETGLSVVCRSTGKLLTQGLSFAGKLLAALLGLQRAAAFQLDRFSLRTGQLLAGSVPIIGQTLSSASESILAGVQMLKSGLGLAALSVLGAEFVPLYLGLMIQLALLMGCSLLCSLTGISRCRALFDCFAEAVRCMAAAVALFFGLAAAGVALLFVVGGGS